MTACKGLCDTFVGLVLMDSFVIWGVGLKDNTSTSAALSDNVVDDRVSVETSFSKASSAIELRPDEQIENSFRAATQDYVSMVTTPASVKVIASMFKSTTTKQTPKTLEVQNATLATDEDHYQTRTIQTGVRGEMRGTKDVFVDVSETATGSIPSTAVTSAMEQHSSQHSSSYPDALTENSSLSSSTVSLGEKDEQLEASTTITTAKTDWRNISLTSSGNNTSYSNMSRPRYTNISSVSKERHENDVSTSPLTTSDSSVATHQIRSQSLSPSTETATTDVVITTPFYHQSLNLSTTNISDCFHQGQVLEIYAREGFVFYSSDSYLHPMQSCSLNLHVPLGLIVHVQLIPLKVPEHSACIIIDDCGESQRRLMYKCDSYNNYGLYDNEYGLHQDVYSFTSSVTVHLRRDNNNPDTVFQFRFRAVPYLVRPRLEILFHSSTAGYVQTPQWDGEKSYPINMDSAIRWKVPAHYIMISFFALNLTPGHAVVSVYFGEILKRDLVFMSVNPTPVVTRIHEKDGKATKYMYVHCDSDYRYFKWMSGFRMMFSIHNKTTLPEQLPDGKWNCSVPYWADFRHHFACNFRQECANDEDEMECPYRNHSCGKGWILLGGRCFLYVTSKQPITWNEASISCQLRGARLASLNTPEEWSDGIRLLHMRAEHTHKYNVYIGLQPADPPLSHIYQKTAQWSDGTIAYMAKYSGKRVGSRSLCGIFDKAKWDLEGYLRLSECSERKTRHYLCELDTKLSQSEVQKSEILLPASTPWTSNSTVRYTECPAGHVTHDFLACNIQSACWSRDDLSASCLAPFFTCKNGAERVPYTFVCDYRSDCSDASDENFCVFPPCRITEFPCGTSRQCVPRESQCDGIKQCINGADEKGCLEDCKLGGCDIVLFRSPTSHTHSTTN
ncbi:hypothetical protein BaRGS_00022792 [Batillaria attramentaria]|uniref:C-type lectin domain-containing protein n=1 Tax=Batillaria attramentaria TaxID=370345 RepID=A0ABD0KFK3_9CAEN